MDYDPAKLNALSEQFLDYQISNDHDIPNSVWQNVCKYYDEKNKYYRVSILWGYIGEMRDWACSLVVSDLCSETKRSCFKFSY